MRKKEVAVSLKSFDRPEYLSRTINSLESCKDKDGVDWHLHQDGIINKFSGVKRADEDDVQECINILNDSDLPNKTIEVNNHNICIPLQTERTFELLSDYDIVIQIESDIIPSEYFIRVITSLLNEFGDSIPSIYREADSTKQNIEEELDKVYFLRNYDTYPIFAIDRKRYRKIRYSMEEFFDTVRGVDAHNRREYLNCIKEVYGGDITPGWDGVLGKCITENQLKTVIPSVSRSSHIGEVGINLTPTQYSQRDYGEEGKLTYERDENPSGWVKGNDIS